MKDKQRAIGEAPRAAETEPDLIGRIAVCGYGGNPTPSDTSLAFFLYRPNEKHDSYYCGCKGWD